MFFLKENITAVIYFLLLINNFIYQEIAAQVVGGISTTIEELPFVVSLREDNKHHCGGAIISVRHILTAAHCLFEHPDLRRITVVAGNTRSYGPGGSTHRISRVTIHPGFSGRPTDNLRNDIAVLTLSNNIQFSRSSQKINLPSRDARVFQVATISGWGYLNQFHRRPAEVLQRAYMSIMLNSVCAQQFRFEGVGGLINGQVCAYERPGVGSCVQDSGSPLSANNEIIGIVSFAIPCAQGFPDIFTRVYAYKSWIEEVMALH